MDDSTRRQRVAGPRPATPELPSRHAVRHARPVEPRRTARAAQTPRVAPQVAGAPVPPVRPRRAASRVVLSALVMTFAAGLVATVALPSYAVDPSRIAQSTPGRTLDKRGQQRLDPISPDVAAPTIGRDLFSATTTAELKRRAYAQQYAAYTGPTASDYIKNPAHPPFSLSAVYQTALQYIGVPYVFGGADPSGFDCSGFIMFVYAQYGVSLPHSVHEQDALAMQISPADAQVGDVVVFNDDSHDGFYAGNGMILHAPYPGARVRVQPLWSSDVHFVRFGVH